MVVGWIALLSRTPLLLVPVAAVGMVGAVSVVGTYRASKYVSATVLRVKTEQQQACYITGALGCLPLSIPFLVYREMAHAPPSISDTLAIKLGGSSSYLSRSGVRAIREAIAPAARFHSINILAATILAGIGHSVSLKLFCAPATVDKYKRKQIALAIANSGHSDHPAATAAAATAAHHHRKAAPAPKAPAHPAPVAAVAVPVSAAAPAHATEHPHGPADHPHADHPRAAAAHAAADDAGLAAAAEYHHKHH